MSNNNSQRPGAAMMEMARSAGMMGASSAKGLLSQVGVRAPVAADNDDSNGANHEPGLGDADEKARRKATREYIALQDKVRAAEKAIAEAPDDEAELRLRRAHDVVKRELELYDRAFAAGRHAQRTHGGE